MRKSVVAGLVVGGLALAVVVRSGGAGQPGTALVQALDEERRARATYEAVVARLGEVGPFSTALRSGQDREDRLLPLFEKYGVGVPADRWDFRAIAVPGTTEEACREAAEAGRASASMYGDLIAMVEQEDVRRTIEALRARTVEESLPAFERCAAIRSDHAPAGTDPGAAPDRAPAWQIEPGRSCPKDAHAGESCG